MVPRRFAGSSVSVVDPHILRIPYTYTSNDISQHFIRQNSSFLSQIASVASSHFTECASVEDPEEMQEDELLRFYKRRYQESIAKN